MNTSPASTAAKPKPKPQTQTQTQTQPNQQAAAEVHSPASYYRQMIALSYKGQQALVKWPAKYDVRR